jgi:hypothetical protein
MDKEIRLEDGNLQRESMRCESWVGGRVGDLPRRPRARHRLEQVETLQRAGTAREIEQGSVVQRERSTAGRKKSK